MRSSTSRFLSAFVALLFVRATSASDGVVVPTSGGTTPGWDEREYRVTDLWAYVPIVERSPPIHPTAGSAIDAYLEAREPLEPESPSRATRRDLLRRATFDLTGLPPTPEEIDGFLGDPSPDDLAFERVVDRLLASPRHAERFAQHWLDLTRYADSAGFSNDYERPNAWRYRDWVIRAFADDMPYDRFVLLQIAGDELLATLRRPVEPAVETEHVVATGFLRMGPWEQTGMSVAQVTRQFWLSDVTEIVGQVFVAQPLQCARCHDHKFDPVPTRDYYAIQSIFATTRFAEPDAAFLQGEAPDSHSAEREHLESRVLRYREILGELRGKNLAAERAWYAERGLEWAPRRELEQRGVPENLIAPRHLGLVTEEFGLERIARKYVDRHEWELDRYRPIALAVESSTASIPSNVNRRISPAGGESDAPPPVTSILTGGDPFSPTQPVAPGVLSAVAALSHHDASVPHSIAGRRLALARWIASPQNPLAARVIVNRVWQWIFGRGLARRASNFGASGRAPTHPELLDALTARFVGDGWSIRRLVRRLVTSQAYARRSGSVDASDASYRVFPMRRLSAEEIRDAMLAVDGRLHAAIGGPPVRPEIHPQVALQPRQIMGTFAPTYQSSPRPRDRHRRTIYSLRLRGLTDPLLEVFGRPVSDVSCERREVATGAPQALALLNGEASARSALALAVRSLREAGPSRESVVDRTFLLSLGRPPTEAERRDALEHWRRMEERHARIEIARPQSPATRIERMAVEEMSGERFAFVEELEMATDWIPDLHLADVDLRTRALSELCLVLLNTNEFVHVP